MPSHLHWPGRPWVWITLVFLVACALGTWWLLSRKQITWPLARLWVRRTFPGVKQISTEELAGWLKEDSPPLLLDVRTKQEYAVSHLPDALHVPPGTRVQDLPAEVTRDRRIVAYCSVGYRSSALVRKIQKAGYRDVYNLEGSIFQWANEGRPVMCDGEQVHEVHPYSARWSVLLEPHLRPKK